MNDENETIEVEVSSSEKQSQMAWKENSKKNFDEHLKITKSIRSDIENNLENMKENKVIE